MTPHDLKAWQQSMGFTYDTASAALGVNRSTYATWLSGLRPIDRRTALACTALAGGLDEWVPSLSDEAEPSLQAHPARSQRASK